MGGQKGGMTNETGNSPEICKKSIQAQLTDIQRPIPGEMFQNTTIDQFKSIPPRDLVTMGRLNTPLFNSSEKQYYEPVSWQEALEKITGTLKRTDPDRTFFYSSGRSSNEAAFLLQLFVRAFGTNNINNCSYYCHQASGVGLSKTIGTGTATIVLEDLKQADMIWVIGANPSSNHPRLMTELLKCRRREGQVIIVNPLREPGLENFNVPSDWRSMVLNDTKIATEYVQPNIGGDIALLKGVAKAVLESGSDNCHFIDNHTTGFDEYLQDITHTDWEEIEISSGIEKSQIKKLSNLYSKSENVVFTWSMGITQHIHGVENVESIVNLALLRGMLGRKNAGLLPLRGHSNVQGVGSMGVTPALTKIMREKIEQKLGVSYPESPGKDTLECLRSGKRGEIDFAFLMGGNLFSASPDSEFTEKALERIPFKVFLTTTLNEGHFHGIGDNTFILPVSARDEEKQPTTQESMFNFVRMSDGGISRLDNVHSEVDIIADIATAILSNNKLNFSTFKKHSHIREAIGEIIPGFERMKTLDVTKDEFQINRRSFHEPEFATPDKKALFTVVNIPASKKYKGQFCMTSIRSEGQFNTIVYEEQDAFRQVDDRWVILINIEDMDALNIEEGSRVTVKNEIGTMKDVYAKSFNIHRGNVATYFPESNVLIPADSDFQSKTPAFKSTMVTIVQ